MLEIASGAVRVYYLFDVADTIDLAQMSALGGDNRAPAALPLRPHAPALSAVSGSASGRESAGG